MGFDFVVWVVTYVCSRESVVNRKEGGELAGAGKDEDEDEGMTKKRESRSNKNKNKKK